MIEHDPGPTCIHHEVTLSVKCNYSFLNYITVKRVRKLSVILSLNSCMFIRTYVASNFIIPGHPENTKEGGKIAVNNPLFQRTNKLHS